MNLIHDQATQAGLEYLVIGGHAVNCYGEPRATLDVDLAWTSTPRRSGKSSRVTVPLNSMNDSAKNSQPSGEDLSLHDPTSPYALDLPAAPDWFSAPPKGTWEDGYRLSLAALEMVQDRPEIFAQREQRRCGVEFVM